jgi:nucleoside 2-deoxyribosyltransferase
MDDRSVFAFVLMPFDSQFDDVYRIGIQEAAASAGVRAERLDEMIFAEGMMEELYRQIQAADIIIADMSDRNPNVFYEVGYADSLEKLCILLTKNPADIPFDLKHRRHIVYDSISRLREQLKKDLLWAKEKVLLENPTDFRIQTATEPLAFAMRTYTVEGTLRLSVDLFNMSMRRTLDLHAIYLYLNGDEWRISQGGNECPVTGSEVQGFKHKYLVSLPATRLNPGGWAHVRIDGIRTLSRYSPETTYACSDPALLHVITNRRLFEHRFTLHAVFRTAIPVLRTYTVDLDGPNDIEPPSSANAPAEASGKPPVDQEGVPIHVGDRIIHPKHGIAVVRRLFPDGMISAMLKDGWRFTAPSAEMRKLPKEP